MNLNAQQISELMSTDTGRAILMERVNNAKVEIDLIAVRLKGITLVGNMGAWHHSDAIPILAAGINRYESGSKQEWRPYND